MNENVHQFPLALSVACSLLAEKILGVQPGSGWQRLEQPVEALTSRDNLDHLAWLSAGEGVRVFWASRDGALVSAGQGVALSIKCGYSLPSHQAVRESESLMQDIFEHCPDARFYGGLAFSSQPDSHWPGFAGGDIVLPRFELVRESGRVKLACHLQLPSGEAGEALRAELAEQARRLSTMPAEFPKALPRGALGSHKPSLEEWRHQLDVALAALETDELDKVVLSREQKVSLDGELCPWSMLVSWQKQTPETYRFAYWSEQGDCFFGASPECLYQRHNRTLESEALAGTAPRGQTPIQDRQLAVTLLADDKNLRENSLVMRAITDALGDCSETVEPIDTTSLIKLRSVQHLRQKVRAYLKPRISDADLLERLHPTPAVGGTPKQAAESLIHQLEPHRRGWYAGPFGTIGRESAELSVAIRSALLQGQTLTLYSGVGLVPGSVADSEWAELDSKLRTVLSLLDISL
ncbi:isochorismate synthase [Sansalvadorimonas verongulae]|uniref:isochorismate synthase n=1 Tax=Sansalvadorimonas verongulae TaxID=2172824 RepID=UPI0012BD2A39|nr:isochorismate synthase [Sansalvadorimonas verongulae]MTI12812.1 isochorismate synthase [Sansalvadorimonas verongulae]